MNPKEVLIVLKDDQRTLREKFLIYEDVVADAESVVIKDCIAKAMENFKGKPEEVAVKISFLA